MATAEIKYIEIDDQGTARIAGTTTKVVLVIEDFLHRGWSPEAIHENYPYLTLAQIHAAFVYYYDHQQQVDAQIQQRQENAQRMKSECGVTPGRTRLRDLGLHP